MVGFNDVEYCLIYTQEKTVKEGMYMYVFYRFRRDPPPSKQTLQGHNISTANDPATPQQCNVRIFTQLLLAVPPICLVEEQFLKFSYLSHILHLASTRCLFPLKKDVIKQLFSASEYIGVARDSTCCHTQEQRESYLPSLLALLPQQGEIFFASFLKETHIL